MCPGLDPVMRADFVVPETTEGFIECLPDPLRAPQSRQVPLQDGPGLRGGFDPQRPPPQLVSDFQRGPGARVRVQHRIPGLS